MKPLSLRIWRHCPIWAEDSALPGHTLAAGTRRRWARQTPAKESWPVRRLHTYAARRQWVSQGFVSSLCTSCLLRLFLASHGHTGMPAPSMCQSQALPRSKKLAEVWSESKERRLTRGRCTPQRAACSARTQPQPPPRGPG